MKPTEELRKELESLRRTADEIIEKSKHTKLQVIQPEITVSGKIEKPYYQISYFDISDSEG